MEKTVILRFTKKTWNTPVIYGLSKKTDLIFNILEAKVLPRQDSYAIINLEGSDEDYQKGAISSSRRFRIRSRGTRTAAFTAAPVRLFVPQAPSI